MRFQLHGEGRVRGLGSVKVKLLEDMEVNEDESFLDARLAALRSCIMNSVGL